MGTYRNGEFVRSEGVGDDYTEWVTQQQAAGKEFVHCTDDGKFFTAVHARGYNKPLEAALTPKDEENICILRAIASGPAAWIAGVGCTIYSGIYILVDTENLS